MNLQEVCRLCSLRLHKPRNIFTTPDLLQDITKITDIQIEEGDGLPSSICDSCHKKLQIATRFKYQIKVADELMRAKFFKEKTELNNRWRSAFGSKADKNVERNNNFKEHGGNRRSNIRRERMHTFKKKSWKLSPELKLNLTKVSSVEPLLDDDGNDSLTWNKNEGLPEEMQDGISTERYLPFSSSSSSSYSSDYSSDESTPPIKSNKRGAKRKCYEAASESLEADDAANLAGPVALVADQNRRSSAAQCPVCDRICVSERGLKVHFRSHRSSKCQICNAPTITKDAYRDHLLESHLITPDREALFPCEICKNLFTTNISLNIHMTSHAQSAPAVKQCPHCLKNFATVRGFKIHKAKSHSGFETV